VGGIGNETAQPAHGIRSAVSAAVTALTPAPSHGDERGGEADAAAAAPWGGRSTGTIGATYTRIVPPSSAEVPPARRRTLARRSVVVTAPAPDADADAATDDGRAVAGGACSMHIDGDDLVELDVARVR
jgi:hypothetical protein